MKGHVTLVLAGIAANLALTAPAPASVSRDAYAPYAPYGPAKAVSDGINLFKTGVSDGVKTTVDATTGIINGVKAATDLGGDLGGFFKGVTGKRAANLAVPAPPGNTNSLFGGIGGIIGGQPGAAEVVETQAEAASRGVGGVNDAANLASRSEPNKRGTELPPIQPGGSDFGGMVDGGSLGNTVSGMRATTDSLLGGLLGDSKSPRPDTKGGLTDSLRLVGGLGDTVKGFTEQGTGTVDGLIGGLGGLGGLGTAKGGLTGARIGKKKRNNGFTLREAKEQGEDNCKDYSGKEYNQCRASLG